MRQRTYTVMGVPVRGIIAIIKAIVDLITIYKRRNR